VTSHSSTPFDESPDERPLTTGDTKRRQEQMGPLNPIRVSRTPKDGGASVGAESQTLQQPRKNASSSQIQRIFRRDAAGRAWIEARLGGSDGGGTHERAQDRVASSVLKGSPRARKSRRRKSSLTKSPDVCEAVEMCRRDGRRSSSALARLIHEHGSEETG
jgi:hypothetical protein